MASTASTIAKTVGIASLASAVANSIDLNFLDSLINPDGHPLLGGYTKSALKKRHQQVFSAGELARKKLFYLRVTERQPENTTAVGGEETVNGAPLLGKVGVTAMPTYFTFYAVDVSYAPYTNSGEKRRVGALSVDVVQSGDPVEMRITTYDNKQGSLKKWFRRMADAAVLTGSDSGLVGLPIDYTFEVEVIQAYADAALVEEGKKAYSDKFLMRVGQIDIDLSRREDSMQELQMTFIQSDQFMDFQQR